MTQFAVPLRTTVDAQFAALATTYLALPTGTKDTGKAPVVQSDGTVQWANVSANTFSGVTQDTDGVYYPSSTGTKQIAVDNDGVYYPVA